jgi:hypothetical protein
MTQTIAQTKPIAPVAPVTISLSLEQIICIHPHAEAANHVYSLIATVAHKDSLKRYEALVIVANPCLAAINRAIQGTLGDRWFATTWEVAA